MFVTADQANKLLDISNFIISRNSKNTYIGNNYTCYKYFNYYY